MNRKLQNLFDKTEKHRKALLNEVKKYDDAILQKSPTSDKWSPAQLLQHLIMAESEMLAYLKKKIQAIDSIEKTDFATALRVLILRIALASPRRFKAPAMIANPANDIPLEQSIKQWDMLRKDYYDFFNTIPEKDLVKAILKHPTSGRINIYQTTASMDWHLLRHYRQIKRALKAI